MIVSITLGAAAGLAAGLPARIILKKVLSKNNSTFFTVWGILLACKLLFVLAVFAGLWFSGWPHPIAVTLALIITLTLTQAVPLKS
ncbi:MAG: hypothetical protein WCS77_10260 [Elusimicrobiaceae bacterium]